MQGGGDYRGGQILQLLPKKRRGKELTFDNFPHMKRNQLNFVTEAKMNIQINWMEKNYDYVEPYLPEVVSVVPCTA